MLSVKVERPDGRPMLASAALEFESPDGERQLRADSDSDGEIFFEFDGEPRLLFIVPREPGFWAATCIAPKPEVLVVLQPIATVDEPPWWLSQRMPERPGQGIRIGVIDHSFATRATGIEHVHGARLDAGASTEFSHGEAVCRLLGDTQFWSFAPHAEITFTPADFNAGSLDSASVASRIMELTFEVGVDLICMSAGKTLPYPPTAADHPLSNIRDAIALAREAGVVCFAAAGNNAESPIAVPAAFDECIGVGAIGRLRWGPPRSLAIHYADTATRVAQVDGEPVFHWAYSGRGLGLNLVAPGMSAMSDVLRS